MNNGDFIMENIGAIVFGLGYTAIVIMLFFWSVINLWSLRK